MLAGSPIPTIVFGSRFLVKRPNKWTWACVSLDVMQTKPIYITMDKSEWRYTCPFITRSRQIMLDQEFSIKFLDCIKIIDIFYHFRFQPFTIFSSPGGGSATVSTSIRRSSCGGDSPSGLNLLCSEAVMSQTSRNSILSMARTNTNRRLLPGLTQLQSHHIRGRLDDTRSPLSLIHLSQRAAHC